MSRCHSVSRIPFTLAALAVTLTFGSLVVHGQSSIDLEFRDGRVWLHAEDAPLSTILREWARLGGVAVTNGDRVTDVSKTLELTGVPEREAIDIVLRGVPGYMLVAREAAASSGSLYERILIVPTSASTAQAVATAPARPPTAPPATPFDDAANILRDGLKPTADGTDPFLSLLREHERGATNSKAADTNPETRRDAASSDPFLNLLRGQANGAPTGSPQP